MTGCIMPASAIVGPLVPLITATGLFTRSSAPVMGLSAALVRNSVNADAKPAVRDETAMREKIIQEAVMKRPVRVIGALSPYPTVVSVTSANHIPQPIPGSGLRGKHSTLRRRSASQIRVPTTNKTLIRTSRTKALRVEKDARSANSVGGCQEHHAGSREKIRLREVNLGRLSNFSNTDGAD